MVSDMDVKQFERIRTENGKGLIAYAAVLYDGAYEVLIAASTLDGLRDKWSQYVSIPLIEASVRRVLVTEAKNHETDN